MIPGVSFGVKKILTRPASPAPRVAAAFSYGWTQDSPESGFGAKAGAQFSLPVSWEFSKWFSLHLTPAVLWTGFSGYPAEPAPRFVIQEGVLFRAGFFAAGISAQSVLTPDGGAGRLPAHRAGGEARFFIPDSGMIFGILAGTYFDTDTTGGFASLSFSFMN
jgi:hypothetical protein